MEVYIGMDVSLQLTHVCAVDAEGKVVHEGRCESTVAAVDDYLRQHGKDWQIKKMGFETGQLSDYLYHGLAGSGRPVVCMDARHAHGVLKAQRIKTDKNDARGLAQLVRSGWYRQTHVKSGASRDVSVLLAGRGQIVTMRVDMENHIRGVLKAYGIKLGSPAAGAFRGAVEEAIAGLDVLVKQAMAALLSSRDELVKQESSMDVACRKLARHDTLCKRLMTIPGVGAITSLAFKAEIDDPTRFKNSRDVGVHIGLTPRIYASGEIDRSGRISKCGDNRLRSLLFEAAHVLLTRSKKWSSLKAWGVKLAARGSFKVACTAVARKLAIIMHCMWVDGTEFIYAPAKAA